MVMVETETGDDQKEMVSGPKSPWKTPVVGADSRPALAEAQHHRPDVAADPPLVQNNSKDIDFSDLINHPQHEEKHDTINGVGINKEEIVPSYDFHPIRGGLSQSHFDSAGGLATARVWNSVHNKTNSTPSIKNYGSLDTIEPAKFSLEKEQTVPDAVIVSEIDRTMKKYADTLLHVLEGVSARITQLDTRTRNLENSVDDLKVSVGNNHGSVDGKVRLMENILREVQSGVNAIRDKQEVVEAQLQFAKLQVSKVDQQSGCQSTGHVDTLQQATSAPQQSHLQPPPVTFPQSLTPYPPPNVPPPPAPQQNLPPPIQLPNQFPQSQIPSVPQREPYFSPPSQNQDVSNHQYQVPPTQPQQPPPAPPPHQTYQPAPQPQYSQPPQLPQHQSSLGHHLEETAYMPSQNYPPNRHQPTSQPTNGPSPSQPYYGAPPSHMYESPSNRSNSGFPTGYGPPSGPSSGPSEPYPYGGPPSQYGSGSTMKPQHSSSMAQSGGGGYPHLPTARLLPQVLPTTTAGMSGGSGSSGPGTKVPIDDLVDKVISMGFPRDHVRATVQKLTETSESVDLNMVLDKLMNDGEVQPQRGWFGR